MALADGQQQDSLAVAFIAPLSLLSSAVRAAAPARRPRLVVGGAGLVVALLLAEERHQQRAAAASGRPAALRRCSQPVDELLASACDR